MGCLPAKQRRALIAMFIKGYATPYNKEGYTAAELNDFLVDKGINIGSPAYEEAIRLQFKYGMPDCCADCEFRHEFMQTPQCITCIGPRLSYHGWNLQKEREYAKKELDGLYS